ncbi:pathogenesis-related protein PR-1 type-like [Rosa rugosa]|uniref:pathogenesis-related protein PR-1 type-like n=1 Tax=Rosa rugosa TaxID=74645 RepID=UPI002B40142F|nr:pathogenesis-related protein PR-1 type-like [Rosa rugosa]
MESSKISFSLISLTAIALLDSIHAQDSPQDFLDVHNAARAEVGVAPLTWDDQVARFAQDYANTHVGDCELVHSTDMLYGENLAMNPAIDMSGTEAVNLWVGEKPNYDYNSNSCAAGQVCGHYTQVVWRNSLRVGCAKVRCNSGGTFIGCNYDPPGNWVGEKPY